MFEFERVESPFLAQFVTQQPALKCQSEFPLATEPGLKSTYIADSMDSLLDKETGI